MPRAAAYLSDLRCESWMVKGSACASDGDRTVSKSNGLPPAVALRLVVSVSGCDAFDSDDCRPDWLVWLKMSSRFKQTSEASDRWS